MGQDIGVRGGDSPPPKKPTPRPSTLKTPTTKVKRQAKLTIITDPVECEIYVNDAYRGVSDPDTGKLVIPNLDTGKYRVRVYKRGAGQDVQTIDVEGDEVFNFKLDKPAEQPEVEKTPEKTPEKPEDSPPVKIPAETAAKPEPAKPEPAKLGTAIKPPQSQMVFIPAGEFIMGIGKGSNNNAKPQRKIFVDAFYIDVYEVTNGEYKLFCDATGRQYPQNPDWDANYFLGKPNFPVVNVSWEDASAYAQWVSKRLPTEAEWEKAARGADGRLWPWGKDYTAKLSNLNGNEDGFDFTAPVGNFKTGVSSYGVHDLAGNVWEWTTSLYRPYPGSPDNPTIDPRYNEDYRVIRGGGFQSPPEILGSVTLRFPAKPNDSFPATGFRCVK